MALFDTVKNHIFAAADMDYVGICPSSALENEPEGHRPSDLLPNAQSIIVFGRRLISGTIQAKFRYLENGAFTANSSYSAHSFVLSINHLCMNETYNIAQYLEKSFDCYAMPVTNNVLQAVQPEGNYAPFFADSYKAGLPLDLYKAAVAAGIGQMGWNHRVLTPDAGPRIYLCAIVTSLKFDRYDEPFAEVLCDPVNCHVCAEVCPVGALHTKESTECEICGKNCEVGKLDVNGCSAACFGFTKKTNPMPMVSLSDHPTDGELAEALDKQFDMPGMQTLDHLPMYHCDKCLIYCPIGNWNEQFRDRGLTER